MRSRHLGRRSTVRAMVFTAAVASLFLLLGLLALRWRGGWDDRSFHRPFGTWMILTGGHPGGGIGFIWIDDRGPIVTVPGQWGTPQFDAFVRTHPPIVNWRRGRYQIHLGPNFYPDDRPAYAKNFNLRGSRADVNVPYVAVEIVLAALPTWTFILCPCYRWLRRTRRRRNNSCVVCGYNLTGNVSGACPECGAATAAGSTEPTLAAGTPLPLAKSSC